MEYKMLLPSEIRMRGTLSEKEISPTILASYHKRGDSAPAGVLSLSELQKTIDLFKNKPIIKEIKIKNKRYLIDITQEEPIKPLDQFFGIPVVIDPDMPKNKFKLIYSDGREKTYDISAS